MPGLRPVSPARCGSHHSAIEQYASLTVTDNQRRRDALEKRSPR